MIHILDNGKANLFSTSAAAVLNSIRKGILFACGFALVLMMQVTFFSSDAIASPIAGIFGNKVDEMTQGIKTDMAIDKAANITKEIGRDLRDGKTDKVIDKLADTSKKIAKEAEKRAKDLAKNVKEGTKENLGKAKDASDRIGEGVDKAKEMVGDHANDVKDGAKGLPDKAEEATDGLVDSVK